MTCYVKRISDTEYANDDGSLRIETNSITRNWELLEDGAYADKDKYITDILVRNDIEVVK